jgi:hypothetical protein
MGFRLAVYERKFAIRIGVTIQCCYIRYYRKLNLLNFISVRFRRPFGCEYSANANIQILPGYTLLLT